MPTDVEESQCDDDKTHPQPQPLHHSSSSSSSGSTGMQVDSDLLAGQGLGLGEGPLGSLSLDAQDTISGGIDDGGGGSAEISLPSHPVRRLSSASSSSSQRAYSEVIAPRFTEITPITR